MTIKIFKQTDVDITINVTGIDVGDITDMSIALESQSGNVYSFTMEAGQITKVGSSINLRIEDDQITDPGTYRLKITATENDNLRGLNPNPDLVLVV
ncbi:hypothetical protein SAMN06296273_1150 [Nitrosomonas ureae]|uniref:Uncharacterized protein n=1 Tax=Nitrosomonas ureae TaxID=44577 RepID=A0A285BY08_9PROT|nr:hypothetical protein [Nitrosomonas ureae]SNX59713.1 hypothetical protein SAMN06296273_1150 [Nitrosomonas ureae]